MEEAWELAAVSEANDVAPKRKSKIFSSDWSVKHSWLKHQMLISSVLFYLTCRYELESIGIFALPKFSGNFRQGEFVIGIGIFSLYSIIVFYVRTKGEEVEVDYFADSMQQKISDISNDFYITRKPTLLSKVKRSRHDFFSVESTDSEGNQTVLGEHFLNAKNASDLGNFADQVESVETTEIDKTVSDLFRLVERSMHHINSGKEMRLRIATDNINFTQINEVRDIFDTTTFEKFERAMNDAKLFKQHYQSRYDFFSKGKNTTFLNSYIRYKGLTKKNATRLSAFLVDLSHCAKAMEKFDTTLNEFLKRINFVKTLQAIEFKLLGVFVPIVSSIIFLMLGSFYVIYKGTSFSMCEVLWDKETSLVFDYSDFFPLGYSPEFLVLKNDLKSQSSIVANDEPIIVYGNIPLNDVKRTHEDFLDAHQKASIINYRNAIQYLSEMHSASESVSDGSDYFTTVSSRVVATREKIMSQMCVED